MSNYCQNFSGDSKSIEDVVRGMRLEMEERLLQASEFYDFDFVREKPVEDRRRFCWKVMQSSTESICSS